MTDDMTRKHFLKLGVGAATLALVPGCPADDDGETNAGSSSTGDSNTGPTTSNPTTSATTTGMTSDTTTSDTTTGPTTTDATDSSTTDPATTDPDSSSGSGSSDSTGTDESSSSSGNAEESSSTGMAADCDHDPDVTIGGNHPMASEHIMVVTLEEVMAGSQIVYHIMGNSLHDHTVTVSAADFATLAGGGSVMIASSVTGHSHTVTVICM